MLMAAKVGMNSMKKKSLKIILNFLMKMITNTITNYNKEDQEK